MHDRGPFLQRGNGNVIFDALIPGACPMGELLVTHARIGLDGNDGRRRRGDHLGRPAARCALRAPRRAWHAFPGSSCCPGSPRGQGAAATVGNTYASLADRIAREAGWAALTFTMRGTGTSEGDFSIEGWLADVRAAIDAMHARTDLTGVWLAGFRLGGTLAIVAAARRPTRPRARQLLRARVAQDVGATIPRGSSSTPVAPACCETPSTRQIPRGGSAPSPTSTSSTPRVASRRGPWLLVHGSDDDVVPVERRAPACTTRAATASRCASCRTVRTASVTTRAPSLRSSAGWTAKAPDRSGPLSCVIRARR